MVAAKLATLAHDSHPHAPIGAPSIAVKRETVGRGGPNKHANLHDFPVERDDAATLAHDSDQHAQICASSQETAAELLKLWPPCWQIPLFPAEGVN